MRSEIQNEKVMCWDWYLVKGRTAGIKRITLACWAVVEGARLSWVGNTGFGVVCTASRRDFSCRVSELAGAECC